MRTVRTTSSRTRTGRVFNDTVRTGIYVASLAASIVGLGFMMFGDAQVGGFISTAAGVVASGFGVAYNPLRNA